MSLTDTLSNSITFTLINEYGKGVVVEIESVFRPVYHVACQRVLWNSTVLTFSNHLYRKFDVHLKNLQKNRETLFCFWKKCIWFGCFKLSLLRRGYLSSPVNVWRNSFKVFRVINRESFQLNYLPIDQWIW